MWLRGQLKGTALLSAASCEVGGRPPPATRGFCELVPVGHGGAEAEVVEGMGLEGPVPARADGRLVGTFHVHAPLRIFSSNGRKRDPGAPQTVPANQKLAESRRHQQPHDLKVPAYGVDRRRVL